MYFLLRLLFIPIGRQIDPMTLYLSSAPLAIIVDVLVYLSPRLSLIKRICLYCLVHRNVSVEVQREVGLKHA